MQFWRTLSQFLVAVQLLPALESGEETLVGGQAVLEGVMMRSPHAWGIACRKPRVRSSVHSEPLERLSEKHKWMGWPVMRGVITLGHAMTLGFRALRFSANVALDELQPAPEPEEPEKKKFEISGWIATVNIVIFARLLHLHVQVLPLLAATELKHVDPVFGGQIVFNLVDGVIRMALFLLFIWGISLWPRHSARLSVSRRRAQDGFAFENGDPLNTAERAEVLDLSSPLRHQLPDDGDDHLDRWSTC